MACNACVTRQLANEYDCATAPGRSQAPSSRSQYDVSPPSSIKVCPVMYAAAGLAR
jgi:hypothetical protein